MTTIKLKNSTVAGKVPVAADLVIGELALNSADGKAFMKLNDNSIKELTSSGPTPPPITPWVRNPTWLPMPATTSAQEQIDLLLAIYPESNYFALNMIISAGTYNVVWGDGQQVLNMPSNTPAQYQYDYNTPAIANTNGPVTFASATSTVNRVAHGYTDGMTISFASIITTTGIIQSQTYYVVNATANTFQVSATLGGTALFLIGNGTGAILPYRQVIVKVTPTTPGEILTQVNLNTKNTTANLQSYVQPILDATISIGGNSSLNIGSPLTTLCIPKMMERCRLLRTGPSAGTNLFYGCSKLQSVTWDIHNSTTITGQGMFSGCSSLQVAPILPRKLSNAGNVNGTTTDGMFYNCVNLVSVPLYEFDLLNQCCVSSMFQNCKSLQTVPLFNFSTCNRVSNLFNGCSNLQSVPAFNFSAANSASVSIFSGCSSLKEVPIFTLGTMTDLSSMFGSCTSLTSVPLFDTANVTNMSSMFTGCSSLKEVPLFNTANVTNMSSMFGSCTSLTSVPLFDTQNVTTMQGMFSGCSSLTTVPLFNTVKVTIFSSLFQTCTNLQSVPAFNTSGALLGTSAFTNMFTGCTSLQQVPDINFNRTTITTNAAYNSMFTGCASLSKIGIGTPNTGPKFTFTVTSCKLSAAALDALYTSLPTVSAQTITVTGNVGIAGDNPAIATAKGWTVTGS
jgi:surface protein